MFQSPLINQLLYINNSSWFYFDSYSFTISNYIALQILCRVRIPHIHTSTCQATETIVTARTNNMGVVEVMEVMAESKNDTEARISIVRRVTADMDAKDDTTKVDDMKSLVKVQATEGTVVNKNNMVVAEMTIDMVKNNTVVAEAMAGMVKDKDDTNKRRDVMVVEDDRKSTAHRVAFRIKDITEIKVRVMAEVMGTTTVATSLELCNTLHSTHPVLETSPCSAACLAV